ncbi:THAP domain-containing protein 11-like [Monomorium pharaonis]|uniref:THAP domain-containing protein 11-like n=1 Tax=Monomorium pharaonis TaxID=307658 RepID=UPI0017473844|nr:THAP domain-containing protein 11-like [Monomorium pharaonis]
MERIVGGFTCAMSNCNENSRASRHLSFFRFPSDPQRSKLWLQGCGIEKDISPQKLHNNYRVCSKHFAPHMFLNDLKIPQIAQDVLRIILNMSRDVLESCQDIIVVLL